MAHEQPAVRTTIVGGRPPGSGQGIGPVPRGIEVLLKKAAVDPAFRASLLTQRAAAASTIALTLTPGEVGLLAAVPAAQLQAMIDATRVPERQRAAFLSGAAAVMLAALGLVGCGEQPPSPAGVRPDPSPPPAPGKPVPSPQPPKPIAVPPPADPGQQPLPSPLTRGVRPDIPRVNEGIRPDVPEPRPGEPQVSAGVRVEPPEERPPMTKGIQPDIPKPAQE